MPAISISTSIFSEQIRPFSRRVEHKLKHEAKRRPLAAKKAPQAPSLAGFPAKYKEIVALTDTMRGERRRAPKKGRKVTPKATQQRNARTHRAVAARPAVVTGARGKLARLTVTMPTAAVGAVAADGRDEGEQATRDDRKRGARPHPARRWRREKTYHGILSYTLK